jgi:hypothetical protein
MKVVNTKITVLDINLFKQFLEHYKITGVFVGVHSKRINVNQIDNFIQYAYDENDNAMSDVTALCLKHGSLEKAFLKTRYSARELEILDF